MSRSTQVDNNRRLVGPTLLGALRNAAAHPQELRHHVARDLWTLTKRFGSRQVENIELPEFPGLVDAVVEGYIDDPNRPVLAALCKATGARSFFEIGTNRGRTAWTVARNNPELTVHTLDLPSPDAPVAFDLNDSDRRFFGDRWASGEAFHDTPEAERITVLTGDSATFDFSPWKGQVDVVFVDGAHSYSYVRNDTEAALEMLSPNGTMLWDDYPTIPGVYKVVNEFAGTLDRPLYHLRGTRLVLYSRQDVVRRLPDVDRLGAA